VKREMKSAEVSLVVIELLIFEEELHCWGTVPRSGSMRHLING